MKFIRTVTPLDGYQLLAEFDNGEKRLRDISSLLDKPVFSPLKNPAFFLQVYISHGAITWKSPDGTEIDLCPDAFYNCSAPYGG